MIPSDYWHDPLCVFIGVMASQAFVRLLKVSGIFLNVLMANYMMFEDRTWLLGARIGMNLVVLLPFSLGLFYTLLVRYPSQFLAESLDDVVTWQEALRCYLLGLIAVLWIAVLVLSGAFDRILAKVGASKMFEDVNMALLVIVEGVNAGRWRMGPQQAEDDTVDGEERDVDSSFFYMSLVAIERMLVLTSIKQFILFIMLILLCVIVEAKVFRGPSVMTCLPVPAVHHMFWAHAVAYSGTLYMICKTLGAPLSAWLDIFYRSIKDENYLIGMELQNSQEVV
ncbi:unnamed protein product [Symbiodinium microadriaticum]|nr:unnamed protein product [Symbiodinium microadriaticum]